MPYSYRDNENLWGGTMQGMGDSFNNAIVGLARLRWQQQQQSQQQMMDRAYLDMAVRKLAQEKEYDQGRLGMEGQKLSQDKLIESNRLDVEKPYRQAQTGALQASTEESKLNAAVQKKALDRSNTMEGLANLVDQAMRARSVVQGANTPGAQGGSFPISHELTTAMGPGSMDQATMLNALNGIIAGAGARSAMMGDPHIGQNLTLLQAGPAAQLPTGGRQVDPGLLQAQTLEALARGAGALERGSYGVETPQSKGIKGQIDETLSGEADPMPTSKDQLVPGKRYRTSRGVATWDGQQFSQ